jgi:hypothetical protein
MQIDEKISKITHEYVVGKMFQNDKNLKRFFLHVFLLGNGLKKINFKLS